ncbi:hypothetical protein EV360DRAFT_75276 [Lentinula raphanica]|nr:hypothetical protein EV360DRAFT_75276 [Lentinula raphanica]
MTTVSTRRLLVDLTGTLNTKGLQQVYLDLQPPPCQGIRVVSCGHITPAYQLGWWIPMEKLPEYFPGKSAEFSTFWQDEVRKPWKKAGHNEKYTSKKFKDVRYQPMLTTGTQNGDAYLFIWITDNDNEEAIDMAQNKEFIEDVMQMAQIKESFDEKLQWIKFGSLRNEESMMLPQIESAIHRQTYNNVSSDVLVDAFNTLHIKTLCYVLFENRQLYHLRPRRAHFAARLARALDAMDEEEKIGMENLDELWAMKYEHFEDSRCGCRAQTRRLKHHQSPNADIKLRLNEKAQGSSQKRLFDLHEFEPQAEGKQFDWIVEASSGWRTMYTAQTTMATDDDLEGVGVGGEENEEDTDNGWDNTLKSVSVILASSKEQMNRKRVKEGRVTNVAQGPTLNLVGPQRVFEGTNIFGEGSSSRIIFTALFERSDTATSSTKRRNVVRDFLIGLRVGCGREGRGIAEQRTGIGMGDLG